MTFDRERPSPTSTRPAGPCPCTTESHIRKTREIGSNAINKMIASSPAHAHTPTAALWRASATRRSPARQARGGRPRRGPARVHRDHRRASLPGHALVRCIARTGRMHQIRAHLAHVGAPLTGYALYVGAPLPGTTASPPRRAGRAAARRGSQFPFVSGVLTGIGVDGGSGGGPPPPPPPPTW